ncbi:MAG: hypothetical protein J1E62_02055 [Lachnospiraceae bacterium]|nr:hypothetical protein [Lachnospiraceae bacterium]
MAIKFDTRNKTPLTEGGEGVIYEYKGKIIKIFKPHIELSAKERKVKALMKSTLPKEIVTPIDCVTDRKGKFIGYSMAKVEGEEFKRLSNRKFVTANNIDTKFILSLLVKVKTVLQDIHKKNIYVGDLNDQNLLFDMRGNVYFLDCDSWTVGGDNCTVVMDLFKDPKLIADEFNAGTDNYAFCVLSWKCLTRIHPFSGKTHPDMKITERIMRGISVIDRPEVTVMRIAKSWKGFSPELLTEFKSVFERGMRDLSDNMEDMYHNLAYCQKDKEYYYNKFSSCPYCNSDAKVNINPVSQGVVGGLKLYGLYDAENIKILFDRNTYIDNQGYVIHGKEKTAYVSGYRYHFLDNGCMVMENQGTFSFAGEGSIYKIDKKYKSMIVVEGNSIFYISPNNNLEKLEVTERGNAITRICKVSTTAYFTVENSEYCIVNYYTGKLIVNINGGNAIIDYQSDIMNYGIHRDGVTGKWLVILEDSKGMFYTYVMGGNAIEYHTDAIKYDCQLSCPCISNSTIFIPISGKIRGFNFSKFAFKDFECDVVSEESKLMKEKNKFVIIAPENVYILG